ncbi:MAG: aldo/keto reductase [Acidobacteria bacterium]|nr:aldo/keto reductase [Acidobacteriota bacterium]
MGLAGFATEEGTRRYAERFAGRVTEGHFRPTSLGWLSSVGVGTYLGEPDPETDRRYEAALKRALLLGANVLDTAINYRFQRSERTIAAVLRGLTGGGQLARDEVVVCTKAGFLTFDADAPRDPNRYFQEEYVTRGIITHQEDVVGGMHCMTPRYLEDQLARSLHNLDVETIDVFYLHNPETQLQVYDRAQFLARIRAAFEVLEGFVAAGKIRVYGTATWNGYRQPARARDFLSLAELTALAEEVAGGEHHFRAVQLPFNLAMPEAFARANQSLNGRSASFLEAARQFGITVFASASILQGQMASGLPDALRQALGGFDTDAQRALQFARSAPGVATALVGMSRVEHVEENLKVAMRPPLPEENVLQLFRSEP